MVELSDQKLRELWASCPHIDEPEGGIRFARAVLAAAQPVEGEVVDPIRDALDRLQQYAAAHPEHDSDALVQRARAVLAAAQGEAGADGPAVQSREPASVVEQPSDEELLALLPQQFRRDLATVSRLAAHGAAPDVTPGLFRVTLNTGALDYARAVLARWGRPAQPAPPAEGEVAELVAWLRLTGNGQPRLSDEGFARLTRAAELLAQAHPTPPAPVPVSAGHPTAADCDDRGRCWWFDPHYGGSWDYSAFDWTYSHWLPAGALPRPGLTTTQETP